MTRTEIKKKIKECLQKFDRVDYPDDIVSETLFNIYPQEMNEICRLFESEFRKLHQPTVIKNEVSVCPECGCNKVQKLAGDNYSCMNAYCEWQTVL